MNTSKIFAFLFVIFGLFESAVTHECQPGWEAHNIENSEDYECVKVVKPPPVPVALAPPKKQSAVAIEQASSDTCGPVKPKGNAGTQFSLDCPAGRAVTRLEMPNGRAPQIVCCEIS